MARNIMSEPEVTTKAPESDTIESTQSQPVQDGGETTESSRLGEHCTTDRPPPTGQQPSGEVTKFDDIDVYVSKPAEYPNKPGKLLLLLTGGTGIKSVNNQLQADAFAREGFLVVMPDQFAGDTVPTTGTVEEEISPSLLDQIKLGFASTAKSFFIDMWLARHTPEKVLPIIHKALEHAKDEYADAVSNGGGVYAAGYCFGAKYVIILAGVNNEKPQSASAKPDEEQGVNHKHPLIKVGAIAHATAVDREDLSGIASPLSMVCVENDPLFPGEMLEYAKKQLGVQNVKHEIKVYPGVPHGFAVVGDYDSESIKQAQSDAYNQMLSWLQQH